jgi:hypothetical protein
LVDHQVGQMVVQLIKTAGYQMGELDDQLADQLADWPVL